jgi:cytochrome c oxidase subunit 3
MNQHHPYHLVFPSPWPLLIGLNTLNLLIRRIVIITFKINNLIIFSISCLILTCIQWWRDISRESSLQGFHSSNVISGLRWGIILFITSEILFFFSFFWAFFHNTLAPNIELGGIWPPLGIIALNPFQVPLLNTTVLLSRGITVTWAHHALILINNKKINIGIILTIILGVYFTLLQAWEYWNARYSLADSSFGSTFFLATGFHGLHVIIGTLFLYFSFLRHKLNLFSFYHHTGLESAIWYWHFVDVVWLFLYSFIYWWSYFNFNIMSILDFQSKSLSRS